LVAVGLLAALIVAGLVLPVPGVGELRGWAEHAGGAAPALMFAVYVIATLVPLPRTVFNIASGLLLGPVVGIVVALTATGLSGWLSFLLARSVGRRFVGRHLEHRTVKAVNNRVSGGGWLAVASIRLIPVVPFLPMNYACGVSSVRTWPYLLGTMVGSLPGTIAVVALGDTLTGRTPPALLAVSAACALLGAAGLWFAIRSRSVDELDEPVE
jgi:uncharacterized membrane protein YdjX (TVP38/TMEM64 family)